MINHDPVEWICKLIRSITYAMASLTMVAWYFREKYVVEQNNTWRINGIQNNLNKIQILFKIKVSVIADCPPLLNLEINQPICFKLCVLRIHLSVIKIILFIKLETFLTHSPIFFYRRPTYVNCFHFDDDTFWVVKLKYPQSTSIPYQLSSDINNSALNDAQSLLFEQN